MIWDRVTSRNVWEVQGGCKGGNDLVGKLDDKKERMELDPSMFFSGDESEKGS